MKILVLQLARFGDILQTLPTIQGLKKKHPKAEITLVVRETFADAARLSPYIDKLICFPSQKILGPVFTSTGDKNTSLLLLGKWILENLSEENDLLLNLTFSSASSFLSSIIPAKEKRGVLANKDQSYCIRDLWSQYFFSQILNKNLNVLHLNDVFARIAEVSVHEKADLQISEESALAELTEEGIYVGIQVGASENHKTLNIEGWKKICEKILSIEPSVRLVFFGSRAEHLLIANIVNAIDESDAQIDASRIIDLSGKLKFHENARWLKACSWLIAPDSSLVHFASLLQTKVIQVSVGAVNPHETGPYGNGHHVLQPLSQNIDHLVWNILQIMGGNKVDNHSYHWSTQLTHCSDGTLRNVLTPVNFDLDETTNFFEKAYYLLAEFRCSGRIEEIEIPSIGKANQVDRLDKLVQAFDALCALRKAAEFGQHFCFEILNNLNAVEKLRQSYSKLQEIEALILKMQIDIPLMKPLIDSWIVTKDLSQNIEAEAANKTESIISYAEGSYRELIQNSEIVSQLLEVAVKKAKETVAQSSEQAKEQSLKGESPHEDLQN